MAFRIISQAGKPVYNLKELVVDTYDDVATIRTADLAVGSTVFVIDTSKYYMLNTQKQWIKVNIANGNGNTSGDNDNPDNKYEIVYDGGEVTE